jgi:Mce-associated membrane protein
MTRLLNRRVLIAVLLVLAVGAGALTYHEANYKEPATTTAKVAADGSYRVGTVGDADAVAAVHVAVAALPAALSYDYRSLDASLKKATALMTPAFAKKFATTFNATVRTMATQKQAITSALVRGAGIVGTVHGGRATVLVFLDQVLVSSKDKKAGDPLKVSQNRVHVSLRQVGGKWRVDDIEPF